MTHWALALVKRTREPHEAKKIEPTTSGLDLPPLCRLSYKVAHRKSSPTFSEVWGLGVRFDWIFLPKEKPWAIKILNNNKNNNSNNSKNKNNNYNIKNNDNDDDDDDNDNDTEKYERPGKRD